MKRELRLPVDNTMFNSFLPFGDIFENPEHFYDRSKTKVEIIFIHPLNFIAAVEHKRPHLKDRPSLGETEDAREMHRRGVRVSIPILVYGPANKDTDGFEHQGYYNCIAINEFKEGWVPVCVRYTAGDSDIPFCIRGNLTGGDSSRYLKDMDSQFDSTLIHGHCRTLPLTSRR